MKFKDVYYSSESREERKTFREGIHKCYFSILGVCKEHDIELEQVNFTVLVNGEQFISLGLTGKLEGN